MGGRGGGSGGGGGGAADAQELLNSLPYGLRSATEKLSRERDEEGDRDALDLLKLTEKQGLVDAKIKELDGRIDNISSKISKESKNNNNPKVIDKLNAQKKEMVRAQENLVSVSKQMDGIKRGVDNYSKITTVRYKTLNPVYDTNTIKNGKYHVFDKNAGLYQKNEMVNPKVSGKISGAFGYASNGKGTVNITHLPSGLSLGTYKKSAVTKEKLTEMTNVSNRYRHDAGNRNLALDLGSIVSTMK